MKRIIITICCIIALSIMTTLITISICNSSPTNNESLMGSMIAILAIIITMSVGYSFFAIYRADGDIHKLREEFNSLKDATTHNMKSLTEVSDRYNIQRTLTEYSMAASDAFNKGMLFRAIMAELDYVALILKNHNLCRDIFESKTGKKRSDIANDLLCIYSRNMDEHIAKIGRDEFNHIQNTAIRLSQDILYSPNFYKLHLCEQNRYRFMLNELDRLMKEANKDICDYSKVTNRDNISKLIIYSKLWDNKRSDQDHLSDMREYVSGELAKYTHIFNHMPEWG